MTGVKDKLKKIFEKKNLVISILAVLAIGIVVYLLIPKHNVFVKGPEMHYPHSGPAVMLQDGRVLVVGGKHAEAEIYDPKKNKFFLTGKMNYIRYNGFTATLLKDGRVLIVGGAIVSEGEKVKKGNLVFVKGIKSYIVDKAEIYDSKTEKFTAINGLNVSRKGHTATLLPNGNVLIVGGSTEKGSTLVVEEFNPKTNDFKIIYKMSKPNVSHTSILLPDNKVLIVGEPDNNNDNYNIKIFDIVTKKIVKLINIKDSHCAGTVTLLNNGNVLITGGRGIRGGYNIKRTVIYDVKKNKIIDASALNVGRGHHTATLLPNGKVLVAGGETGQSNFRRSISNVEIYDTDTNKFKVLSAKMSIPRYGHTSVLLKNGNVLIMGGSKDAELFLY